MKIGEGRPISPEPGVPISAKTETRKAQPENENKIQDSLSIHSQPETKSVKDVLKRVGLIAGGIAAGAAFATVGALAVGAVSGVAAQFVIGAMPNITIPKEISDLFGAIYGLSLEYGTVLAAAGGAVMGALSGNESAKPIQPLVAPQAEVTSKNFKKNISDFFKKPFSEARQIIEQTGTEVHKGFQELKEAESWKEALGAGANTGSIAGGNLAGVGGKIEGQMAGFGMGSIAGIPLMMKVPNLAAVLPVSIGGAVLGGKLGQGAGMLVGSALGSIAGTTGAGIYYGIKQIAEAVHPKPSTEVN